MPMTANNTTTYMNYLEFKRTLMTDPFTADPAFERARKEDPSCHEAWEQAMAFEESLRQALIVDVPADLASDIIEQQRIAAANEAPNWRRRLVPLAAAASFVMALAVGLVLAPTGGTAQSLPDYVISHLYHEVDSLGSQKLVDAADVNWLMAEYGVELNQALEGVVYLKRCPTRHGSGIHMVVSTESGPVTVYYLPKEQLTEPVLVGDERFSGYVVGLERGALALVGSRGQQLEKVERQLRNVMRPISV